MTRKPAPRRKATRKSTASRGSGSRVVWTDRSLDDLEAIGQHIARDDPAAAARWVAELMRVAEAAATMPEGARRVPELGRDDIRETFKRTYRIVYRIRPGRIEVLTVFEGHRLFPPLQADDD